MNLYRSVAGSILVELISADIPDCLRNLAQDGIPVFSVSSVDDVTLKLIISRKELPKLKSLCDKKGYGFRIERKMGLFWPMRRFLARPILLIGMIALFGLGSLLPGRILFISVEGNDAVPTRYILEQAGNNGLRFWTRRRDIRSEQLKNALLEAVPQLQWVGVNTFGCRAVITVRERSAPPIQEQGPSVRHIVAARDGVIQSCTVIRGCGNCMVGQAVRAGDILISGYTDCGLTITAERAEGDVMARTKREIRLITPANCRIQSLIDRPYERFSLLIGKKRINFYKGSGISGATCDKMYSKYVLTLPGGYSLPLALLKEITLPCVLTEVKVSEPLMMLEAAAADYLTEHMTDGAILRKSEQVTESEGLFLLNGSYDCLESIGLAQEEKIGEFDG